MLLQLQFYRSQWLGFGDDGSAAISTQNFSIDAEIPILSGGLGLNIVKDNIGEFSNLGLQASYAFRTQLGIGQLRFRYFSWNFSKWSKWRSS